jgi:acetylornithine deacetylase/succinyl-diaminopimelate desuccinylase-like protein
MDPIAYLRQEARRFREEWKEFLRIPSVSAQSAHAGDVRRAAEWLAARLKRAGLRVEVRPTPGHPVVIGTWEDRAHGPTLLVYGHYDVQPPEPLDEWDSPEANHRATVRAAAGSA